jgi:hypothetical protein
MRVARGTHAGTLRCTKSGARIGVNGERERRIWAPAACVHTARNRACNPFSPWAAQNVSKYVAQAHKSSLALRYPSDIAVLTGVRSHRCFGREVMHQMLTPEDENATLAWLEDALGQAYAHGHMTTLAYLEAVMEDAVFVMEMVRRESFTVG